MIRLDSHPKPPAKHQNMSHSYTLVVRRPFVHDGREYTAGEEIGTVAADIPWGTILSVTGAADRVVAIDDDAIGDDADEPDETEELVASSDLEAAEGVDSDDDPPAPTDIDPAPGDELAQLGLSPKIVEALTAGGIATPDRLLEFVADGGDLLDLDGIKKADKTKILAALKV